MTDVMTTGQYPDDPLPGPRMPNQPYVWTDTPPPMLPGRPYVWTDTIPSNLILEPPMYFPGAAWKGTSGMEQRGYA